MEIGADDNEILFLEIGEEAPRPAHRMGAVDAGERGVGRARRGGDGGVGDGQKDALHVVGQPFGELQHLPPFVAGGDIGGDIGAAHCQAPAKRRQGQRLARHAVDAAADQEILIEHGDGPEAAFGIVEHVAHDAFETGIALGGIDLGLPRWRSVSLRQARAAELGEDIGRRGNGKRRWSAHRTGQFLGRRGEDQRLDVLGSIGQRPEFRIGGLGTRFDRADHHRQRAAGQGRAERHEMAARQVAEHLGLPPVHAQQIGGADHVDIEEGAAHEEVGRLGRNVLGELGEALRGDDTSEATLAAAAHEIGHGAE